MAASYSSQPLGFAPPHYQFAYIPEAKFGVPAYDGLIPPVTWANSGLEIPFPEAEISKKRSKRHPKHRSKKSHDKKSGKHRLAAYILQVIGLICLVLAAIKSFEALAGIGFMLVLMGHDSKVKKAVLGKIFGDSSEGKARRKDKDKTKRKSKKRRDESLDGSETETVVDARVRAVDAE